ncbi:unnamed protein product [Ambrosiozyma monospora]|uniref:Unnamed protein product n=1 Tax=Ambrosiozyma monospora TaxID=43982 RepID=A0ACB5SUH9_AMBMO|nr:unnamed protein product [Ambrosiozyma monospora]
MNHFVSTNHILPDSQYGGRAGASAVDPILMMVHDVKKAKGKGTALIADIKGAYDGVNTEKLLEVMKGLKLPEAMIRWTAHFTKERTTALLTHHNQLTKVMKVKMGIPQGSVISPLLFQLYTTPLIKTLERRKGLRLTTFMDDYCLLRTGPNFTQNTNQLEQDYEWLIEEGLRQDIHFDEKEKLQFIHFKRGRAIEPMPKLKGKEPQKVVKLLGIYIDNNMNFKFHVQEKIERFKRLRYMLSRFCKSLPISKGRDVYNSCVRSVLEYGSEIWSWFLSKKQKREMEMVQRLAIRQLLGVPRGTPTAYCNKELGVMPLENRFELRNDWFMSRLKYNMHRYNPIFEIIQDLKFNNQRITNSKYKSPLMLIAQQHQDALLKWKDGKIHWKRQFINTYRAKKTITENHKKNKETARIKRLKEHRNKILDEHHEKYDAELKSVAIKSNDSPHEQRKKLLWLEYRENVSESPFTTKTANLPMGFLLKKEMKSVAKKVVRLRIGCGKLAEYFDMIEQDVLECECKDQTRTREHMIEECELTKDQFEGATMKHLVYSTKGLIELADILKTSKTFQV